MPKLKKFLIYLTFIISALVFLSYYLFPSELVRKYISYRINQSYPDLQVVIGHAYPALPPGLKLESVSFEYAGNRILETEQIRVVPELASLLSAKKNLCSQL